MPRQDITYWKSPDGLSRLSNFARSGSSDTDIAKLCGVAPATLKRWRKNCRDIDDALTHPNTGCEEDILNDAVEKALFRLATGFTLREERTKDGKNGEESTVVIKEVAPNFSAASFWLRSRMPERWNCGCDDAESQSINILDEILCGLDASSEK